MTKTTFRMLLVGELSQRKARRSSYSLRAFSRDLKIPASTLSEYISGKAHPSKLALQDLARVLGWTEAQQNQIASELSHLKSRKHLYDHINLAQLDISAETAYTSLILSRLPNMKSHSTNLKWIANHFLMDPKVVKEAIGLLKELQVLDTQKDKFVAGPHRCVWADYSSSRRTTLLNRKIISHFLGQMKLPPSKDKAFVVTNLPILKSRLPEVMKKFDRFSRSLTREFKAVAGDEIYTFVISCVPARGREKIGIS